MLKTCKIYIIYGHPGFSKKGSTLSGTAGDVTNGFGALWFGCVSRVGLGWLLGSLILGLGHI